MWSTRRSDAGPSSEAAELSHSPQPPFGAGTANRALRSPVTRRSAGFEIAVDGLTDDVADLAVLVFGEPADALVGVIIEPDAQARGVTRAPREGGPPRPAAGKPSRIESFLGFVRQRLLIFSAERRAGPAYRLPGWCWLLHCRHLCASWYNGS